MPRTMIIHEPVLNDYPNVRNGPILGHTLELVIPARVRGGLFAHRVDSPAFSWWETITFWDLVNGSWVQRGASTGPVDQATGANNTGRFLAKPVFQCCGRSQLEPELACESDQSGS